MVIPKIHENLTRSNTWQLPNKCPCCDDDVSVRNDNGSKTLYCTNPNCKAKLIAKLVHATSKNALNIDGMSEATIEKFVSLGWVKSIKDIYYLRSYFENICNLEGFGEKSIKKLLDAIENSRHTDLSKFLFALSIPLIGKTASKDIAKACNHDINQFRIIIDLEAENAFMDIDGFGEEMNKSLYTWWNLNRYNFCDLAKEFIFEKNDNSKSEVILSNKVFVITGSLTHYRNRAELISVIEQLGGKVSGSVSSKTSYLINNDVTSTSGKNRKANELGIPIISEENFIKMIS